MIRDVLLVLAGTVTGLVIPYVPLWVVLVMGLGVGLVAGFTSKEVK